MGRQEGEMAACTLSKLSKECRRRWAAENDVERCVCEEAECTRCMSGGVYGLGWQVLGWKLKGSMVEEGAAVPPEGGGMLDELIVASEAAAVTATAAASAATPAGNSIMGSCRGGREDG